jgi:hypothetical protein
MTVGAAARFPDGLYLISPTRQRRFAIIRTAP